MSVFPGRERNVSIKNPKPRRKIVHGMRVSFDVGRLREWLTLFAYEFDDDTKTVEDVIWEAFGDWEQIDPTTLGYHTKESVAKGGTVTEHTRNAICRMLRAFADTEPEDSELRKVIKGITPGDFILRRGADELHRLVADQLRLLNRPYYGLPHRGWEVWGAMPRILQCLRDIEPHLRAASTDKERLRVATLAWKWIEAAHYCGGFSHSLLRGVYQLGVRAARMAEVCRESEAILSLLGHESPVDALDQQTVSGTTWHKPLSRYGDYWIAMSLRKHDHARAKYIEAACGQEDNFTVSQTVVAARLKLCSDLESRTADAWADLSHAEALLGFGTERTRAYFHMARHYYYSRRIAGLSTRSVEWRQQLEELRQTRDHYAAHVRAEWHIWTAACEIRLAELSPTCVPRARLIQAVETILSTPFDRCCVTDLSGVVDGSSVIYRRIPFDRLAFSERAVRQCRARAGK